ncbi:MAG: transposase [Deltaproteobacteria bacterium]|nr:transposase [Deltaproteobacteria bacterium]
MVFTFPFAVRLRMARDPKALSAVLRCCKRALFTQLRRRSRALGIKDGRPAAITAIQVYGGALNLNVHFHVITPDALFVVTDDALRIEHLSPPTDEDIDALLATVRRKVERLFEYGQLAVDEVAVEVSTDDRWCYDHDK